MRVCTLGDLLVDVVVRLSTPLAVGGDADADNVLAPGGQAANVAAWCVALGVEARLICKSGADEAGRLARAGLEVRGVEVAGPAVGRNGIVCSLVSPDGERSMLTDRGAAPELGAHELEPSWFGGCDHLLVSGYTLLRDPVRGAAFLAVELARAEGASVSVDLSSWSSVERAGSARFRNDVAALEPDVVFANEDEDRVVGGRIPGPALVLKRGARGCSFDGDERSALPVEEVVDTTGAGDALAAGYLVGGPDLALEAAARCVQKLGTMP
jgi:sugar/nucleoside kinase (ribokinase family)